MAGGACNVLTGTSRLGSEEGRMMSAVLIVCALGTTSCRSEQTEES
jgi:hypothetical protein